MMIIAIKRVSTTDCSFNSSPARCMRSRPLARQSMMRPDSVWLAATGHRYTDDANRAQLPVMLLRHFNRSFGCKELSRMQMNIIKSSSVLEQQNDCSIVVLRSLVFL